MTLTVHESPCRTSWNDTRMPMPLMNVPMWRATFSSPKRGDSTRMMLLKKSTMRASSMTASIRPKSMCRSTSSHSGSGRSICSGVQSGAEAVSEEVEPEYGGDDEDPREDRDPPRFRKILTSDGNTQSPFGRWGPGAKPDEAERRGY